ncbi:MAG: FAD-dependent oxidoreductase [Bacteroidota bacterium]|nr:FAD-dependent oxidoreductase [Bacteroidota bacterium]
MRNILVLISSFLCLSATVCSQVFVEAESFTNKGGWVVDQQFMDQMGSPFLMAHGLGTPVADASTTVTFPEKGNWHVFVRTRNWTGYWTDKETPGKFQVKVNGKALTTVFGSQGAEWNWQYGGTISVKKGNSMLALHDLTGFNGRCDAIVFSKDASFKPANDLKELAAFRKKMLNLPAAPEPAGQFDFVVVGGGMAGICAAISAARLGLKVALIQDRPVLGGNNSSEVRVHLGARINLEPYPALGNLVNEIGPDKEGNARPAAYYEDDKKLEAVKNEKNITLFLNCRANAVKMNGTSIAAVIATNTETSKESIFTAPLFADCTGDGTIGALAGADFMMGRESRGEFNEPTAPEKGDKMTMGASVQWNSEEAASPVTFPDITWGLKIDEKTVQKLKFGDWNWETGMEYDQIKDFERIRDYGLLVVFSNWSYLKNHYSKAESYRNSQLKWVAYVAGKRESRRLIGDLILKEQDLKDKVLYPDGTAPTSWSIDLHYPDPKNTAQFPGNEYLSIARHIPIYPYPIPYRCMYSRNVPNLFMAGRNISVTHVALGTVRLMRTGGMMGEVLGMAASLCKQNNVLPRDIYEQYFPDLKKLMEKGVGKADLPKKQNYNLGRSLLNEK